MQPNDIRDAAGPGEALFLTTAMIDPATLDRMIALLPPEYGVLLSVELEPRWRQRQRRLAARDDAIRRALGLLAADSNPPARLAEMMAQQAGQRWGVVTGDHLVVDAVRAVLVLNDGAPMTERHLRNVASGDRTPRK